MYPTVGVGLLVVERPMSQMPKPGEPFLEMDLGIRRTVFGHRGRNGQILGRWQLQPSVRDFAQCRGVREHLLERTIRQADFPNVPLRIFENWISKR